MFSKKIRSWDFVYISSIFLLSCLSLLVLYGLGAESGESWISTIFIKQFIYTLIGIAFFFVFSHIDYRYFKSLSTWFYFSSITILVFVLVVGETVRGTVGWIQLGSWQFQPVEIVKIALILFLASFIAQKKTQLHEKTRIITSLVLTLTLVMLVLLQPDFGSAMILMGIWLGTMLFSGMQKKYIFLLLFGGILLIFSGWFLLEDYQKLRVINVIHPQADARGSGYNVIQSIIAVGSGGMTGKGIGQGSQSQLNFLPEKHTDFIFAATTESLGFIGAMFVLSLYLILLYRIKTIALTSHDSFGYFIALGAFSMFFIHIFINIGMNMGILPVTGIPLPLLSYGGSSLVSTYILLGIVLSIQRSNQKMYKKSSMSTELLS